MSTNTRPVKMVQLVMLDMWRVEGGPCISTLQLMRLSRLTCLGSTYFLVKINVWSVMLESEQELETQYPGAESTTDRLDISGTITGVLATCRHLSQTRATSAASPLSGPAVSSPHLQATSLPGSLFYPSPPSRAPCPSRTEQPSPPYSLLISKRPCSSSGLCLELPHFVPLL